MRLLLLSFFWGGGGGGGGGGVGCIIEQVTSEPSQCGYLGEDQKPRL